MKTWEGQLAIERDETSVAAGFTPAWVEVDLGAVVRNARSLATRTGTPLLPMVKADAYGLGMVPVARALEGINPWGYGVATSAEGRELRGAGIERPILMFDPPLRDEIPRLLAAQVTPVIGDSEVIRAWVAASDNAPWHLAIDTGMSRSGVRWDQIGDIVSLIEWSPPQGACTHFHSADADNGSMELQLDRFRKAVAALAVRPRYLHAENSPAIERLSRESVWDMARPGVFIYGVQSTPPRGGQPAAEPVVSLNARIIETREIAPGDTVSYGGAFRANERRRIATVAAGYADGYRRALSGVGKAIIKGKLVPVAGIVTMDMTMLDVTGVDCSIGDVATLLGRPPASVVGNAGRAGGREIEIRVVDAAASAGISPYELLAGLRMRLPRVYLDASLE